MLLYTAIWGPELVPWRCLRVYLGTKWWILPSSKRREHFRELHYNIAPFGKWEAKRIGCSGVVQGGLLQTCVLSSSQVLPNRGGLPSGALFWPLYGVSWGSWPKNKSPGEKQSWEEQLLPRCCLQPPPAQARSSPSCLSPQCFLPSSHGQAALEAVLRHK